ncbi:hypothetical protein [Cryobacterium sp. M91]|uniref:hypothetical protein n=1 Tax=Cryobacterium sp. M91 TaxID=2048294 RepID=UPI000CE3F8E8|nr:hypothetical protein [Cryobacterium sp. M91]
MMNLTFVNKSLLVGDEVAELVVKYAATLARSGGADTVRLMAYGAGGDEVQALLLLSQGTPVMAETSHTDKPEPDNRDIVSYMRQRVARTRATSVGLSLDLQPGSMSVFEDDYGYNFETTA